jgi:hypothetical protein
VYRRKTKRGKWRRESGIYPFHLFQAFHKGDDTMSDPFACAETGCHYLVAGDLDSCEKERHCPFAYQRRREEDAIEREAKDVKMKEERMRVDA